MNALVIIVSALGLTAPLAPVTPATAPIEVLAPLAVAAPSPDRADELAAEAYRLFTEPRSWRRAARLLEQSAALRSAGDPERTGAYLVAARLYAHVRALADARRAFEAAAQSAVARGAVAEAAHAFLDAATAAALDGEAKAANALMERGALLAGSPHLDAVERSSIVARLPERVARRG